jgi:hypothetical protein
MACVWRHKPHRRRLCQAAVVVVLPPIAISGEVAVVKQSDIRLFIEGDLNNFARRQIEFIVKEIHNLF